MPYLFDAFVSYKRGRVNEQWLNEIFLPYFKDALDNVLDHEPLIFVDKTGLTPGADYEEELYGNLIASKSLVAVWSPPYFRRSEWCLKEFLTMRFKQEYHQLDNSTIPKTLLWPIMYRVVKPLPAAVQNISFLDYSDYNVVGEAFFKSKKFLKLQKQLESDITSIAHIIDNAPDYDENWETPVGRDAMVNLLKQYFQSNGDFDNPPKQNPIVWPK